MVLGDLLNYQKVTIQCHDNPDADTIASGFALYTYLLENGRNATLMYSGKMKIQKDNLRMFVTELSIPIEYWEDHSKNIDGLLVTVDCQYGANNVTKFKADDVIVIDHHQQEIESSSKTHIISNMGSCSTVVWQLLNEVKFNFDKYPEVQTALYYGLYSDTIQFVDINNPIDRDMQDSLAYDNVLIHRLQNSNINAKELEIAGIAMIRAVINEEKRFAVVKAGPCDPNILGLISDFVLQVSEIDLCVVFNVLDHGIKYSVRSCVRESNANHVAQVISKGIGNGGGHKHKAGGYIGIKNYDKNYGQFDHVTYFTNKLKEYLENYEIVENGIELFDKKGSKKYKKKKLQMGYVKLAEFLPIGADVTLRTAQGDLLITVREDTYVMIGISGEIYQISEKQFKSNYKATDSVYDIKLRYRPKIKQKGESKQIFLLDYARSCVTTDTEAVFARPLKNGVKIFANRTSDTYKLGEKGDYVAAKCDDLQNIFVIDKDQFELIYEKA